MCRFSYNLNSTRLLNESYLKLSVPSNLPSACDSISSHLITDIVSPLSVVVGIYNGRFCVSKNCISHFENLFKIYSWFTRGALSNG